MQLQQVRFPLTLKTGKLKLQKENLPTGNTSVSLILQERSREVLDGFHFEKGTFCKTAMKTLLGTYRSHDTLLRSAADVLEALLLHYVRINMNRLSVCIADVTSQGHMSDIQLTSEMFI